MNKEQIKSFSAYFFDLAKGITLGSFGLPIISSNIPLSLKISVTITGLIVAVICIKIGLDLLNENEF